MPWARRVWFVSAFIWLCMGQGYTDTPGWREHSPAWYLEHYGPSHEQESPSRTGHGYQQCNIGTVHLGVYPVGFGVQEISGGFTLLTLLDSYQLSENTCLQKCCALGPTKCQYLWFFETYCVAVACSPSQSDYCGYAPIPSRIPYSPDARYVSIQYSNTESSVSTNERTFPPPAAVNNQPPLSEDAATSLLPNQPPEVGILPEDIVTQDSEVVLSAQLSDHQGAVQYSWELVAAEPPLNRNQVVIVTEGSMAHLSKLSPGVYTVQLTVKDAVTGLKNSARTTVTVLPAPSSPPLVVDVPHTPSPNSTTLSAMSGRPTKTAKPLSQANKSQSQPRKTKHDQIKPTQTTTVQLSASLMPPAVAQAAQPSSDSDYSLYVKVGVPILAIVLLILAASGCIVGAASCVMFHGQSDKTKYRYRRLIYTDT